MKRKDLLINLLLVLSFFCGSATMAQTHDLACYHRDPEAHERNRNIDVTRMKVEVSFDAPKSLVMGKVTHVFNALQDRVDTIFLDGPGIQVKSASLDGKKVNWRSNAQGIIVETGLNETGLYKSQHTLELVYEATPKRGIYFIGWNLGEITDPANMSRRQIWTQGQGIDNRHWIPMIDDRGDKFITEVVVKFDKEYKVLSNGKLMSCKPDANNTLTWHYSMEKPHAGYLLMLAIDKFGVKKTKTSKGTPIEFWYYPENPEKVEPTSRYTERIIEFLENEIGVAYPWGTYAQVMVQDFLYGAMENTGATVFGDFFNTDERGYLDGNYVGVNCHEAVHQWFGDLITARHDGDHWLQESFATFYPTLFFGDLMGPDEMRWQLRGSMNAALAAGEKNSLPVRHSMGGTARHYPKGAVVLSMLYYTMGRENFRRGIKLYLERHGFSGVETADLQKAMIDATGMNMDWFFDQWVHRGGEPHFKISTRSIPGKTIYTVEQIHPLEPTVGFFKMPVNFYVYYTDGTADRKQVMVEAKAFQEITIENPFNKTVSFCLFDEGGYILKKVTFEKTQEQWLSQLKWGPNMIDRYDALLALGKNKSIDKASALIAAYSSEKHRAMRVEIIKQLIPLKDLFVAQADDVKSLLAQAAKDPSAEVRKTLIDQLGIDASTLAIYEAALKDSSYAVVESALVRLWENVKAPEKRVAYLDATKGLRGKQNSLLVKWLELSADNDPERRDIYISQLTDLSGEYYEFRTRINAMNALKRLNVCNDKIVKSMLQACLSFNTRLGNPAKDVLLYFKEQTAYQRMIKGALITGNYTPEEVQKLKDLLAL